MMPIFLLRKLIIIPYNHIISSSYSYFLLDSLQKCVLALFLQTGMQMRFMHGVCVSSTTPHRSWIRGLPSGHRSDPARIHITLTSSSLASARLFPFPAPFPIICFSRRNLLFAAQRGNPPGAGLWLAHCFSSSTENRTWQALDTQHCSLVMQSLGERSTFYSSESWSNCP